MTKQLQSLDISTNKPFKDYLKMGYDNWLMQDNLVLTSIGKVKKTSVNEIAHWVDREWEKIPGKMVEKFCISSSPDGADDDVL